MKNLICLPYVLLFGSLALVSCADRAFHQVDTSPIQQGLVNIDESFQRIQKEKTKSVIDQIAAIGRKEVATTKTKLEEVQLQANKLAGERDWWKSDSETKDAQIQSKDVLIKKKDKKLDLLGLLLASAAAWLTFVIAGFLIPYINPSLTVYSLIGRGVLAGLVFLAVFSWVRYL